MARGPGPKTKALLAEYHRKRDFGKTREPAGDGTSKQAARPAVGAPTFMVHKHHATRMHYDVRLEIEGVLASWAVPKGPSFDPAVKRLAVQTEDHPFDYGGFEGRIPDDEYGGGDSLIWDRGTYDTVPPGQAAAQRRKGHLEITFHGEKLVGRWHLVKTRGMGGKAEWIMFKAKDEHASSTFDVVAERPESVVSGRRLTRGPERASVLRAVRPSAEVLLKKCMPPMLATLVDEAPPGDWVFEMKYDGFRALCGLSSGKVVMWSRNALDLSARFPTVAKQLAELNVGDAVIDGEIVAMDDDGVSRFERLQQGEAVDFYAFDLLWLDGEDLRGRPLEERRDLLISLLDLAPEGIHVAERIPGTAAEALEDSARRGAEGVIAKAVGSTYESTRSKAWLKLKAQSTQEVAIVGWNPSTTGQKMIGSLHVAVVDPATKRLRYAGKVGTGYTAKVRRELHKLLSADEVGKAAVDGAPRVKVAHWVTPKLVGQVRFTEWTRDGKLRHPAFLGLRDDKTPMECVLEKPSKAPAAPKTKTKTKTKAKAKTEANAAKKGAPAAKKAPPAAAKAGGPVEVNLSSPDKVLYPRDGLTKADLAAYYAAVADAMLPTLAGRPLALQHWPKGIDAPGFFHQSIGKEAQPWMHLVETPTSTARGTARHLVADRPEALRWLAQYSALHVHMWSSREASLESPDWIVFDLDPAEGHGIEQAIPVAHRLHRLLDELGLPSVPKTSGKRGLHVFVPLAPGHTFDQATGFAERLAVGLAEALPDEVTVERSLKQRHGRLYLDYLQNGYGKTIIAPYSPRAVDGAPVSAPLAWDEVKKGLDPMKYTIRTMPKRLAKVGDLFAPALAAKVKLPTLR